MFWTSLGTQLIHIAESSACALLHKHIRREMALDPLEAKLNESYVDSDPMSMYKNLVH